MFKNTAGQTLRVFAFNTVTSAPVTGDAANITCKVAIDGGSAAALADVNPAETEDGYYLFSISQSETNGDTLDFYPESSSSNIQVIVPNFDRHTRVASESGSSIVSGAATLEQILDALNAYSDFEEQESVSRAKSYITAARRFLALPSTQTDQGSSLGYSPDMVRKELEFARAYVRSNRTVASAAQSSVRFLSVSGDFR